MAAAEPSDQTLAGALSHIDAEGHVHMVDVGDKAETPREATARGRLVMQPATLALIQTGGVPKGDVFAVAQVAGIMAAKRADELIPLCHPLPLTYVAVTFTPITPTTEGQPAAVEISATVRTVGRTGAEMEALVAVAVAGLTIYDMCKAVDRSMRLEAVRLVHKSGGKSGEWSGE
ncbi:MAG: cyclic pyranopterin monophosphate synthase MoaC [Anaerolineae bacterium]|nr:cyclic pyranopterin monophosphate synthase MoaC [Anaerolineae bacterium]MDW8070469.1 cyclic pyranopterin monophosphate synthase MoaC [Anaerolineae bacterium]